MRILSFIRFVPYTLAVVFFTTVFLCCLCRGRYPVCPARWRLWHGTGQVRWSDGSNGHVLAGRISPEWGGNQLSLRELPLRESDGRKIDMKSGLFQ